MADLDDDAATVVAVGRNWSRTDGGGGGVTSIMSSVAAGGAAAAGPFPECICSDLQHDDYSPLYAWFNYIIIIIMLPSLSVFGIITNCVNVFIFSRKRMQNSANTYLFFLACSDFMVIITGLFIFWIDSARSYIDALSQAPYTTVYTLPFGYMAQTCSVYFTVAAAFDCYIAVCWRRAAFHYCTPRRARQINGCIVFCSIVYNSLRFPQFNLRKCFHDGSQELILEICPTSLFFAINTVYNVYMYMVLMTILPFFLLLMLNALIIIQKSLDTTRKSRKTSTEKKYLRSEVVTVAATNTTAAASLTNGSTPPPPSANYRGSIPSTIYTGSSVAVVLGSDHHFHRRDRGSQAESGLARRARSDSHASSQQSGKVSTDDSITMIMVVVLFLSCNTLAIIVNVIETFFEPDALLLNLLSDTSNFLVVFNSSVNCVIYMIFNAEYRELFLIYFLKVKEHNCFRQFCTRVTALSASATTANGRSAAGQGIAMAQQQQRSRLLYQPQQRTMVEKFLVTSNNGDNDGEGNGENGSLMRDGYGGEDGDQDQFIVREDVQSPIWLQYTQPHQHQQQHAFYRHGSKTMPTVYESQIGEVAAEAFSVTTIPQSATQLSFEPSDVELLQLMDDDGGDDMSTSPLIHLLSSNQRHNKIIHENDSCIGITRCCPMHCPLQCQSSHCTTMQLLCTNTTSGFSGRAASDQLPISVVTSADNNNNSRSAASLFHHRPHIYVRPFPREEQLPNDISNNAVVVMTNNTKKKDEFQNVKNKDHVEQRKENQEDDGCDSNNGEYGGFSFTEI